MVSGVFDFDWPQHYLVLSRGGTVLRRLYGFAGRIKYWEECGGPRNVFLAIRKYCKSASFKDGRWCATWSVTVALISSETTALGLPFLPLLPLPPFSFHQPVLFYPYCQKKKTKINHPLISAVTNSNADHLGNISAVFEIIITFNCQYFDFIFYRFQCGCSRNDKWMRFVLKRWKVTHCLLYIHSSFDQWLLAKD